MNYLAKTFMCAVLCTAVLASPMPQSDGPNNRIQSEPEGLRLRRQGLIPSSLLDAPQAESRDDAYAPPSYHAPAPYHPHHKGGPVYVRTFVKTDYKGNFKWGVKHNIDNKKHH